MSFMHGKSMWVVWMVCLYITLTATFTIAKVTVKHQEEQYKISGSHYEAIVAADGCLISLKIYDLEFLQPDVGISRGAYFYQGQTLKLPTVKALKKNSLMASSDKASVHYEFDQTSMIWTVENKTNDPMRFFMVLAPQVEAVLNPNGEMLETVINADWEKTTWFHGQGRLEIIGSDKQWGPWEGEYQVWEALLAPRQERRIVLRIAETSVDEAARIKELTTFLSEAGLRVLSPQQYQVFQRQSKYEGYVVMSGWSYMPVDTIEARLTGRSLRGKLPGRWQSLPFVQASHSFALQQRLDAGGWYQLELRALKDGRSVAQAKVEKFGVGEVFVGAGQSNATNHGEVQTKPTSGMVSAFSGTGWQLANDPQPGAHDHSTGGSFWPAFGDAMFAKYGVPIGVAITGHEDTNIYAWRPDGELFNWTLSRIHRLGPLGFRALLWHQGEADVQTSSNQYYRQLAKLIRASKNAAAWEFPWFVAQVSYLSPTHPSHATTREAQSRLWNEGLALEGPDTDTLTGDYRDRGGEGIHFSAKGLKAHGEMWAEKVSTYLDQVLRE